MPYIIVLSLQFARFKYIFSYKFGVTTIFLTDFFLHLLCLVLLPHLWLTAHIAASHWTALFCAILHCTALHYLTLHCSVLFYTALHCSALHWFTLYWTTLHNFALHCTSFWYFSKLQSACIVTVHCCEPVAPHWADCPSQSIIIFPTQLHHSALDQAKISSEKFTYA